MLLAIQVLMELCIATNWVNAPALQTFWERKILRTVDMAIIGYSEM